MKQIDQKYRQLTDCSCNMLRETTRSITQFYESNLRAAGIKATQFNVLAALANLGPVTLSTLADALSLERTGLTRNLNIIERNGWVNIEAGKTDSRQRIVSLSQNGYAQLDRAIPYWEKAQHAIAKEIDSETMMKLKKSLNNIKAANTD